MKRGAKESEKEGKGWGERSQTGVARQRKQVQSN